jgi:formylglycine-generating enzyme required for sulfatase activity
MGERGDTVTVAPFFLDTTEVTVAAYTGCTDAGRCPPAPTTVNWSGITQEDHDKHDAACNGARGDRASHPVNCVEWSAASGYCAAQGKRLPTEEEWEWAARGAVAGTTYPWGNNEPKSEICWSGKQKLAGTCVVGSLPGGQSPQGIKDLAGNVWEWTGTRAGSSYVNRGGSWFSVSASKVSAANRNTNAAAHRSETLGFRCARNR